jgi:hypothetical protein
LSSAVDEHLLDHVALRQMRQPLRGRQIALEKAQRGERRIVEVVEVDVVQLHVHDEVVGGEQLARGGGVVALLRGHRQHGRVAGALEPVHRVQHHVRGGGARRGAQKGAPRQTEPLGAPVGLFGEQGGGGALLRVRRPRAPFTVGDVPEGKRQRDAPGHDRPSPLFRKFDWLRPRYLSPGQSFSHVSVWACGPSRPECGHSSR